MTTDQNLHDYDLIFYYKTIFKAFFFNVYYAQCLPIKTISSLFCLYEPFFHP